MVSDVNLHHYTEVEAAPSGGAATAGGAGAAAGTKPPASIPLWQRVRPVTAGLAVGYSGNAHFEVRREDDEASAVAAASPVIRRCRLTLG